MQVNGIDSMDFDTSLLLQRVRAGQAGSDTAAARSAQSFMSMLTLRIAELRTRTFDALLSTSREMPDGQDSIGLDAIFGMDDTSGLLFENLPEMSGIAAAASGRNAALFDPESAYGMMTEINTREVGYKAEFAEMSDMKSCLAAMREEGMRLGGMDATTTNDDMRESLRAFAVAYNGWIDRFDQDLEQGGVLSGTQAARVSQWELEQSVGNCFTGAAHGFRGMRDLGLGIDSTTGVAKVDNARLELALAANRSGVIDTLREFGADFARSAQLLNSDGNFVSSRLDNLDHVIDYLDANKASLQQEFGLGDAARPGGTVAQALERYKAMQGLSA
jgi:hypothetical protein